MLLVGVSGRRAGGFLVRELGYRSLLCLNSQSMVARSQLVYGVDKGEVGYYSCVTRGNELIRMGLDGDSAAMKWPPGHPH